jgi:hypothetical protein
VNPRGLSAHRISDRAKRTGQQSLGLRGPIDEFDVIPAAILDVLAQINTLSPFPKLSAD